MLLEALAIVAAIAALLAAGWIVLQLLVLD